ncbi:MAG: hypothetical protein LBD79_03540 [Treponema sp.]|jgi:hypothetical protein|nr:hypothetical protein [Treponema sp.]
MNQDQVKATLLSLEDSPLDFTLVYSGKASKKVNGFYKLETREIIIHNRNFTNPPNDNLLLYTAIHEYAHHLHACACNGKLSSRAHTAEFWAIFHGLLEKAEAKEIYKNVFALSPELNELTITIRRYLFENGSIVKELGTRLFQAQELCTKIGGRFEDYIDRVLRIPRQAATLAMKIQQFNLNPALGSDNMRFLAGISNESKRDVAEAALLGGKSPDTVRSETRKKVDEEPKVLLEKERARLERTIASLSKRLSEVQKELEGL